MSSFIYFDYSEFEKEHNVRCWIEDNELKTFPELSNLEFLIQENIKKFGKNIAARFRQNAYQIESDPLYFLWQRGKATEKDWIDKVTEIENRYPDPL